LESGWDDKRSYFNTDKTFFRIIVFPISARNQRPVLKFPLHYILANWHVLPEKETHAVTKNIAYD
jgi:hypothetical protein